MGGLSFRANAELQEQRGSPRQATNQIDAEYSGPKSKPNVANDSGKDGGKLGRSKLLHRKIYEVCSIMLRLGEQK